MIHIFSFCRNFIYKHKTCLVSTSANLSTSDIVSLRLKFLSTSNVLNLDLKILSTSNIISLDLNNFKYVKYAQSWPQRH